VTYLLLASAGCRGGDRDRNVAADLIADPAAGAPGAEAHEHEHTHEDPHLHDQGLDDGGAGDKEVEQLPSARVVELAGLSVRKMEELSQHVAAVHGDCAQLAKTLDAFRRDNATSIAEMNGLDEKMTKVQRRMVEQEFTAPMQKAMTALLDQMISCKDDPAVAKAFLKLQR
jgi:hypothetical protein